MHNETEISEMVYSLSRLFRLSLNRGERLTSVSNETEMLKHYLLLQKMRLKNKLNYKISFDDDILKCIIPKLMLQPFVENAILHGLDGKEEGGTVQVTGTFDNDKLRFSIYDDGIGMDMDTVERLLDPVTPESASANAGISGYAISNVNERLKIMYGEVYKLAIESKKNMGTKVTILIPYTHATENREAADD